MNQDLTEIIVVLDRSASMGINRDTTISSFNELLDDQKKAPGKALMTFTQFNTDYEIVHDGMPLQDVPKLTIETYVPGGMTALYDAIGRTIDAVGARLSKLDEALRPSKVIFAVLSDGEENSSKEYNGAKITAAINHQKEKYNWQFLFLGADEASCVQARSIGIQISASYDYKRRGTRGLIGASRGMSSAVRSMRAGSSVSAAQLQANVNQDD